MTNHVRLNNIEHRNLKVISKNTVKLGNNISNTIIFPNEFIEAQREYPILFSKNPETGEFQSSVLLGLNKGDNLFLKRGRWQASYIPAIIAKGPFVIGFDIEKNDHNKENEKMVVYIDMDNARTNYNEGESIFDDQGNNTPYLHKINLLLAMIDNGIHLSKMMFTAFKEYDLIEPVTLDIVLSNNEKIHLAGHYTIHTEKLLSLNSEALKALNSDGFLQMAYYVAGSLNNVQKLINLKNNRIQKCNSSAA